jgi:hypothetical protein
VWLPATPLHPCLFAFTTSLLGLLVSVPSDAENAAMPSVNAASDSAQLLRTVDPELHDALLASRLLGDDDDDDASTTTSIPMSHCSAQGLEAEYFSMLAEFDGTATSAGSSKKGLRVASTPPASPVAGPAATTVAVSAEGSVGMARQGSFSMKRQRSDDDDDGSSGSSDADELESPTFGPVTHLPLPVPGQLLDDDDDDDVAPVLKKSRSESK